MNVLSRLRAAFRRPDPTDVDAAEFRLRLADEARCNQGITDSFARAHRDRIDRALPPLPTTYTRKAGRPKALR